ncbi:SIMPL domain-containing protein [Stutzerimonas stutzeri]|nr:SIMPL domain-containing protein [Stutzerimonas stutzeri]
MQLKLTHYQIKALLEMSESSGDPECYDTIVLQMGDEKGHSGPGLYAWFEECPEEGASFIGTDAEDQARASAVADAREQAEA